MSNSGAKAALQGYRRQALYTLARILRDGPGLVFQPEGSEDLAVFGEDERLIESVQVKSYAEPLVLSNFKLKQADSFFKRASDLTSRLGVTVRVASFGPVGAELRGAWAGTGQHREEVTRKLTDAGLQQNAAARLYERVEWEQVNEDELLGYVLGVLRESLVGGEPESAFDLLVAWLYVAAERQQQITHGTLIRKITDVGRYLAERAAYHQEWFTTVQPLLDELPEEANIELLAEEFYRGISARYVDILAGNDVERPEKLTAIHEAFESGAHAVIVHGASGQGKSTLAYRYLHDFIPEAWRFVVVAVESRTHALQVATALSGHLRAINAPMYVYIDVTPRDLDWPELVRALVQHENVRVLITIREEDFARLSLAGADLRFPKSIPLSLEHEEANAIYKRLLEQRPADRYLSFDDAWRRFGGEGPLLEFIHLVTQSESLRDRLAAQIRRLKGEVRERQLAPEALQFLRAVSVANAYEARVDVVGLATELRLIEPALTLDLLEREYLLRRSADGRVVEGLHPIRSSILAEELSDPAFYPWISGAIQVTSHIVEADLESFLLHSFARHPADVERILAAVQTLTIHSWTGIGGIARALLWLGVRQYINENDLLIRELSERFGDGWWTALDMDLARVNHNTGSMLSALGHMAKPGAMKELEDYRARQTEPSRAFSRLVAWIQSLGPNPPRAPEGVTDWMSLAETYFWAAHLRIDSRLTDWAREVDLGRAVLEVPLPVIADLVLALSYGAEEEFEAQVGPHRNRILERYLRETETLYVEDTGDALRSHFIVPLTLLNDSEDASRRSAADRNPFHSAAIRRIELLRCLMPGRQRYGSQGYGHHLGNLILPRDETNQPGVMVEALPPRWLPRVNATFRVLADWRRRPVTWGEHVRSMIDLRRSAIRSLQALREYLIRYFRTDAVLHPWKKINSAAWDQAKVRIQRAPKLPRTAVDEWGFSAEDIRTSQSADSSNGEQTSPKQARSASVLDAHEAYLRTRRDYTWHLQVFLNHATSVLTVNSPAGRAASPEVAERLRRMAERLGVRTDLGFLSAHNLGEALKGLTPFQRQFRQHVGHLAKERELFHIEREEANLLPQVWRLWYQFATHPSQRARDPQGQADAAFHNVLEEFRGKLIRHFGELQNEGIVAAVFSETIEYDDRPALWLRYEAGSPIEIYPAFQRILGALQEVFGKVESRTLEMAAIDFAWPNVLIVPVVIGHNLEGAMWRLPLHHFFGNEEMNVEEWWKFVPQPLPDAVEIATGVRILRHPQTRTIFQLQEMIATISVRAAHVADLGRLHQELSSVGEDIAETYVAAQSEHLSTDLQQGINLLAAALEDRPDDEVLATRPHLRDSLEILLQIRDYLVPHDQQRDDEWVVQIRDMPEWVERLQKSLVLLDAARLLRTADALETSE